ncbi:MAG: hypothetical protein WKF37_01125 [Bryobacteraceae bacterium]
MHLPNLRELGATCRASLRTRPNSPKWPAVFPALDAAKVQAGAALYSIHCSGCHLPSIDMLKADYAKPTSDYWAANGLGRKFLRVRDVPIDRIGIDSREALDFKERTADSGDLGKGNIAASEGLEIVTKGIA